MLNMFDIFAYIIHLDVHLLQTKRIVTELITGYVTTQVFISNSLNVHQTIKSVGYTS
jgi:hypothetical protein